jgi:hypothetical protein
VHSAEIPVLFYFIPPGRYTSRHQPLLSPFTDTWQTAVRQAFHEGILRTKWVAATLYRTKQSDI